MPAIERQMATAATHRAVVSGAMQDVVALTLDAHGVIRDCNRAGEALFEYSHSELVRRHVSMLLPQLADRELVRHGQIDQGLRFHCHIGCRFRALTRNGKSFASDLFFNLLHGAGDARLLLLVRPAHPE